MAPGKDDNHWERKNAVHSRTFIALSSLSAPLQHLINSLQPVFTQNSRFLKVTSSPLVPRNYFPINTIHSGKNFTKRERATHAPCPRTVAWLKNKLHTDYCENIH